MKKPTHEDVALAHQARLEDTDGMRREALRGVARAQLELQKLVNDLEIGLDVSPLRLARIGRALRRAHGALDCMPAQLVAIAS